MSICRLENVAMPLLVVAVFPEIVAVVGFGVAIDNVTVVPFVAPGAETWTAGEMLVFTATFEGCVVNESVHDLVIVVVWEVRTVPLLMSANVLPLA